MHARKSLCCCESNWKGDSGENLERKEEICQESLRLLGEHLSHPEQNVDRNVDSKVHSDV